jgi:hypothetical protein
MNSHRFGLSLLGSIAVLLALAPIAPAQSPGVITVSECPGKVLPLPFQVDCSHVVDPETRAQCMPFAMNQACKVFFAYRTITGINLENRCRTINYVIYDADKWPHPKGEGGLANGCGADYIADNSIKITSPIGPYDVHELLHIYQVDLGALPYEHILFGPSMAEARRMVGDNKGYWDAMTRLKQDLARIKADFQKGNIAPDRQCLSAELQTESDLYLQNPANLHAFYTKLQRSRVKDPEDRERRFNRMYNVVSSGTVGPFLLAHCPAF